MKVMHTRHMATSIVLLKQTINTCYKGGASGNKFLTSISTHDCEFKRPRMEAFGVVPLVAKPAHTITKPHPNCRLKKRKKKKELVFLQVIPVMAKTVCSVRINFFFHQKIHLSTEAQKKTYFLENFNLSYFWSFVSGGHGRSLAHATLELFCRTLGSVRLVHGISVLIWV